LQDSAYASLRSAIANVAIFFGFVGVFTLSVGAGDGVLGVPLALCVLAGVLGAGYYAVRRRPRLAGYFLVAASVVVIIGVAGVILVRVLAG
jgi:hypothetical protein